jgi:threonylcarbamoyladenosine tRNA methylthiotransferase MtaB
VTLGCKVNSYESTALENLLTARGYEPAVNENPEVVVINTCSVTSTSDQKSRQHIRSLISKYPHAIMVAMGCYVQMAHTFVRDIPGVDIVVGTSQRGQIPDLIDDFMKNGQAIDLVDEHSRAFTYEPLKVTSYTDNARAFLKIQDGCDNYCSYCIIPLARGKMRSRPKEEILEEVGRLVESGYREIVLTGIHTAGYGTDLGYYRFVDLLQDIIEREPRLFRLRISSIEDSEISDEFIAMLVKYPVIARHLHIPMQSGSDTILKRMNRKYDTTYFLAKLRKIREAVPQIAITTDVIVGFPGETEEAFAQTVAFIKEARFSQLHVFPFSPRTGTVASRMKDQIDGSIKKQRVQTLLALSAELQQAYAQTFIGQEMEIIIEDRDPISHQWRGHTSNYLESYVESPADLRGKIVKIKYVC